MTYITDNDWLTTSPAEVEAYLKGGRDEPNRNTLPLTTKELV